MGMLVVSRRNGEGLFITKDIRIRVLDVNGNQVRLGIDAPKDMAVYREELRERFEEAGAIVEITEGDATAAAAAA